METIIKTTIIIEAIVETTIMMKNYYYNGKYH